MSPADEYFGSGQAGEAQASIRPAGSPASPPAALRVTPRKRRCRQNLCRGTGYIVGLGRALGFDLRVVAWLCSLLWLCGLCGLVSSTCDAQPSTEYQVKAVFLFRFAEFVEWPSVSFASPQSPIVFGVLGINPFGDAIEQAVRGEKVHGRSLTVKYLSRIQESGECHILFISRSEASRIPQILASLDGRSILTICDSPDFINEGGMIQFVFEEERVRFKINQKAAEAAKLRISAKLLRLSQ